MSDRIQQFNTTVYRVDGKEFPTLERAEAHVAAKEWVDFRRSVSFAGTFTVHEDHLALMKASAISWQNCEFGSAGVDCKRPYGSSGDADILRDIAKACGVELAVNDPYYGLQPSKEQERFLYQRHWEMEHFVSILFAFGEMPSGTYVKDAHYRWQKAVPS